MNDTADAAEPRFFILLIIGYSDVARADADLYVAAGFLFNFFRAFGFSFAFFSAALP